MVQPPVGHDQRHGNDSAALQHFLPRQARPCSSSMRCSAFRPARLRSPRDDQRLGEQRLHVARCAHARGRVHEGNPPSYSRSSFLASACPRSCLAKEWPAPPGPSRLCGHSATAASPGECGSRPWCRRRSRTSSKPGARGQRAGRSHCAPERKRRPSRKGPQPARASDDPWTCTAIIVAALVCRVGLACAARVASQQQTCRRPWSSWCAWAATWRR
jgi:hypothetical protein